MSYEKRVKKRSQCGPKKNLGTLQKDNKSKIPTFLLHVRDDGTYWSELSNRAPLGKGKSWGIYEIRSKGPSHTVLSLQHPPGRNGSSVLRQDAKGKRKGIHDQARKG